MASNSASTINKDTGTDILMSGISVILLKEETEKCYTTARETGEQTIQGPWPPHLDFTKALSRHTCSTTILGIDWKRMIRHVV